MLGIELLNNTGMRFIGDKNVLEKEEKTIIVVGVARGGTSLVAGALHHLGVFGGERSVPPVFEDVKLATAYEQDDKQQVEETISLYNQEHSVWFYKRPSSIHYVKKLMEQVRNPVFMFIFKDIFAIANRNTISMKLDVVEGLGRAYKDYGMMLEFIQKHKPNGFLLSYEKVMENKDSFIEALVEVVGKQKISPEQKQKALDFIEPNPKAYLDSSRTTKSMGRIGSVADNKVIGWAKYAYNNKPATVELYINDVFIAQKKANDFRPKLLEDKVHPTGHCGYVFELEEGTLKSGDKVQVKVQDDVRFLNGSPWVVKIIN